MLSGTPPPSLYERKTTWKAILKRAGKNLEIKMSLILVWRFPNTVIFSIGMTVLVCGVMGCVDKTANDQEREKQVTAKTIIEVLKEHTEELMSLSGVVGTAQGLCNDNPCIKVLVIEKTPELTQKIPDILEGYQVIIEETGEIRALPKK